VCWHRTDSASSADGTQLKDDTSHQFLVVWFHPCSSLRVSFLLVSIDGPHSSIDSVSINRISVGPVRVLTAQQIDAVAWRIESGESFAAPWIRTRTSQAQTRNLWLYPRKNLGVQLKLVLYPHYRVFTQSWRSRHNSIVSVSYGPKLRQYPVSGKFCSSRITDSTVWPLSHGSGRIVKIPISGTTLTVFYHLCHCDRTSERDRWFLWLRSVRWLGFHRSRRTDITLTFLWGAYRRSLYRGASDVVTPLVNYFLLFYKPH